MEKTKQITDEEIKAFYQRDRKDVFIRITYDGKVRRHYYGQVGYDDLGTRAEAVALLNALRANA